MIQSKQDENYFLFLFSPLVLFKRSDKDMYMIIDELYEGGLGCRTKN